MYLSFTFTFPDFLHLHYCHIYIHIFICMARVNIFECVSVYTRVRVIGKVILSLGLLSLRNSCFNRICRARKFIKSEYEMLKFNITWTRFESNYNSCTCGNIEKKCKNSVGAREKRKTR